MPPDADDRISPDPPRHIPLPMSVQEWRTVTFVHWRADAAALAARVPPWLRLDTVDGSPWVSLVAFGMRVHAPVGPAIPWLGDFAETNVRTYVVGPDGERGLWFFSLDAQRLPFVMPARAIGIPYVWSSMALDARPDRVRYRTRRRLAFGAPASSTLEVMPGASIADQQQTPLDVFLTARFRLYARGPAWRFAVQVEHPRWPLRRARIERLEDRLVAAAGIRVEGDPLVHYSDGVRVRLGLLEPLTAQRSP
jgi:uncharacterized protein YqjF (DUF2071 family)